MKYRKLASAAACFAVLIALALGCSSGERTARPRPSEPNNNGSNRKPAPSPKGSVVDPGGTTQTQSDSREATSPSTVIRGRVVGVSDGDTIVVFDATGRSQYKVRLATIDCPEKTQDFGVKAKESLSSLVFGKDVEVEVRTVDRYGRNVGVVRIGGSDMNLEQVKRGFAWHYTQYANEQPSDEFQAYAAAERRAREARVGLWADSDPVPPWDFRRAKRKKSSFAE